MVLRWVPVLGLMLDQGLGLEWGQVLVREWDLEWGLE